MEQLEQQLKAYTEADEISMDKILEMKGLVFEEVVNNNGSLEIKKHIALPITIGKLNQFYDLTDDLERSQRKFTQTVNEIKNSNADEETKAEKTIKANRAFLKTNIDKRLEIALMCFERTEKTTKEEIANWITNDILEKIDFFALGLSLPPKQ